MIPISFVRLSFFFVLSLVYTARLPLPTRVLTPFNLLAHFPRSFPRYVKCTPLWFLQRGGDSRRTCREAPGFVGCGRGQVSPEASASLYGGGARGCRGRGGAGRRGRRRRSAADFRGSSTGHRRSRGTCCRRSCVATATAARAGAAAAAEAGAASSRAAALPRRGGAGTKSRRPHRRGPRGGAARPEARGGGRGLLRRQLASRVTSETRRRPLAALENAAEPAQQQQEEEQQEEEN